MSNYSTNTSSFFFNQIYSQEYSQKNRETTHAETSLFKKTLIIAYLSFPTGTKVFQYFSWSMNIDGSRFSESTMDFAHWTFTSTSCCILIINLCIYIWHFKNFAVYEHIFSQQYTTQFRPVFYLDIGQSISLFESFRIY